MQWSSSATIIFNVHHINILKNAINYDYFNNCGFNIYRNTLRNDTSISNKEVYKQCTNTFDYANQWRYRLYPGKEIICSCEKWLLTVSFSSVYEI